MPTYGFDETVTEQEWSYALTPATWKGCVYGSSAWAVAPVTGQSRVKVSKGMGQAAGIRHHLQQDVLVDVPVPNSGGKWWMLVARYSWLLKSVTFALKASVDTGASSGRRAPEFNPQLSVAPGEVWEQPIAWVWAQAANRTVETYDLRLGLDGRPVSYPVLTKFKRESGNLVDAMKPNYVDSIIDRTFRDYPRGWVHIGIRATLQSSSRPLGSAGNIRVLVNDENRSEDSNHFFDIEASEWSWWDGYYHRGGDLRVLVQNGALNGLVHRNGTFMTLQWLQGDGIYD
jgi:hypothetical protein